MAKITEILWLRHEGGCTQNEIGRSCGLSQITVHDLLRRAREARLACRRRRWVKRTGTSGCTGVGALRGRRLRTRSRTSPPFTRISRGTRA